MSDDPFAGHLLFDHKYDIDDILRALCGDDHDGRWLLCTRDGSLVEETDHTETATVQDGDDRNHWHVITPLPVSFISELKTHDKRSKLTAEDVALLDDLLADVHYVYQLLPLFEEGLAGGWVRERVKETALEWLDMKNLIPPSMRHVYDATAAANAPAAQSGMAIKII
ncbi:MAG: hypothetical protein GC134_03035 [Proteobacteria bacterium]|nr:hypothetical protein [Pseudomonadota bacterium]